MMAIIRGALNGTSLSLVVYSMRAIVMTNVLRHLPEPQLIFIEATRCVRSGGVLAIIEPWAALWSRFVYTRLHHEPFEPEAPSWALANSGPLSKASIALPWIVFSRDRLKFEQELSDWLIELIQAIMSFRYLLSGGVSLRNLAPAWSFKLWDRLEITLGRWNNQLAVFAQIVVRRLDCPR